MDILGWSKLLSSVTKLFFSNRSQAVRIPVHLRMPDSVKDVEIRACGQERIISPLGCRWESFFNSSSAVPDDFMSERYSQEQSNREDL